MDRHGWEDPQKSHYFQFFGTATCVLTSSLGPVLRGGGRDVAGTSILDSRLLFSCAQQTSFDPASCILSGAVFGSATRRFRPLAAKPKRLNPALPSHSMDTSPTLTARSLHFAAPTASSTPSAPAARRSFLPSFRRAAWSDGSPPVAASNTGRVPPRVCQVLGDGFGAAQTFVQLAHQNETAVRAGRAVSCATR